MCMWYPWGESEAKHVDTKVNCASVVMMILINLSEIYPNRGHDFQPCLITYIILRWIGGYFDLWMQLYNCLQNDGKATVKEFTSKPKADLPGEGGFYLCGNRWDLNLHACMGLQSTVKWFNHLACCWDQKVWKQTILFTSHRTQIQKHSSKI